MLKSIQYRRLLWLSLLVVLAYCGLGWRLVDMQFLSATEVRKAYAQGAVRELIVPPMRGDILDRNGATLTTSVRQYNIGAEPPLISPHQAKVAAALAGPLKMDVRELTALLTPVTNQTADGQVEITPRFVMLKRGLSFEDWSAVKELKSKSDFGLDLKALTRKERNRLTGLRRFGIQVESEVQTRQYPNDAVAGQILGYVGQTNREYSVGKSFPEQFGLAGIERAFNKNLAGVPGFKRVVQTDSSDVDEQFLPAVDGLSVQLTIDRRLQEVLDRELASAHVALGAEAVFGVMMDVNTGEILAMSSAPGFKPGKRDQFDPAAVRLRPILDEFEPGSIFKVIAISGALEDGVVDLSTPIDCLNGIMRVKGMASLTDVHPYDVLTVKGVVTKSSNIGTAQIVRLHGHDRFYHWLMRYGIGTRTGVGLAEGSGAVRGRKDIYPGEYTRLPIGYGLKVTQLQLASAYAALANGGQLMQPRLVSRLVNRQGEIVARFDPTVVRQVVSPETSRKMIEALQTVTEPGGTAPDAALEHYTVAGKTGTAHKFNTETKKYDTEHYYSSFVGFFPASAPRVLIAITVDEPDKKSGHGHYGGKAAGPIFRKVAEDAAHILNLKPDRQPTPANRSARPDDQAAVDRQAVGALLLQPPTDTASSRPDRPTGFRLSPTVEPSPR